MNYITTKVVNIVANDFFFFIKLFYENYNYLHTNSLYIFLILKEYFKLSFEFLFL